MGGRGRIWDPSRWLCWGNRVGRPGVSPAITLRRDAEAIAPEVPETMPPRKAPRELQRARTKTDTGGRVENTKAIEKTLVKELGKIAP
jgi:hypothetical protein